MEVLNGVMREIGIGLITSIALSGLPCVVAVAVGAAAVGLSLAVDAKKHLSQSDYVTGCLQMMNLRCTGHGVAWVVPSQADGVVSTSKLDTLVE